MKIFINGSLVPQDEAKVSVLDRGFLYGDGVFETLRSYSGKIFHPDEHVIRLFKSADSIYLRHPFTDEYLASDWRVPLTHAHRAASRRKGETRRDQSSPGLDI